MADTRILVVDDSVVVRKVVSDQLSSVTGIEVMATAANGRIALQKIERERPDVVILDVEMPVMDGLETLREIKRLDATIRVIMFSSFTTAGAQVTVDALALGAEDYVAKPSEMLQPGDAAGAVQRELIAKIKMLAPRPPGPPPAPPRVAAPQPATVPGRIDILAIGSSTGGPNALAELFARFPANLAVPIVIVQHMPVVFTKHFAERLSRESALKVEEASEGLRLRAGHAYVARGGQHMRVVAKGPEDRFLTLDESPPVQSCRPSVDVLFDSVTEVYGGRALAVVLTGMGEDGLRGARTLHAAGGRILVQDEESSVVWGMAGAVARAGLADAALTVHDLADEIVRRVAVGRR